MDTKMTRQEANLEIIKFPIIQELSNKTKSMYIDDWNFMSVLKQVINDYPDQRFGQLVCNYICPDYRNPEVYDETKLIMNTLFPGNPDPFFEESTVTLKRLQDEYYN